MAVGWVNKYPSKCAKCDGMMQRADEAMYFKKYKGYVHRDSRICEANLAKAGRK
jgi:hypothetical protein